MSGINQATAGRQMLMVAVKGPECRMSHLLHTLLQILE